MNRPIAKVTSLRRKSLHEELALSLRELIVSGELKPSEKIPEKDLCDMFSVSRTPLREALKVLAADGLVHLEPNRGAWVTPITVEDIEEVFPVMGALEALSGELACQNITDEQLRKIRKLHQEMLREYEKRNLNGYFQKNQEIHEAILTAARNHTLTTQYNSLAFRIRRARYVANMSSNRWSEAIEEHEQIIDCLERRDGKRLSEVLKEHLRNKLDAVKEWLRSTENGHA
jgi:DNA-binding GntR family transcriptional regulator